MWLLLIFLVVGAAGIIVYYEYYGINQQRAHALDALKSIDALRKTGTKLQTIMVAKTTKSLLGDPDMKVAYQNQKIVPESIKQESTKKIVDPYAATSKCNQPSHPKIEEKFKKTTMLNPQTKNCEPEPKPSQIPEHKENRVKTRRFTRQNQQDMMEESKIMEFIPLQNIEIGEPKEEEEMEKNEAKKNEAKKNEFSPMGYHGQKTEIDPRNEKTRRLGPTDRYDSSYLEQTRNSQKMENLHRESVFETVPKYNQRNGKDTMKTLERDLQEIQELKQAMKDFPEIESLQEETFQSAWLSEKMKKESSRVHKNGDERLNDADEKAPSENPKATSKNPYLNQEEIYEETESEDFLFMDAAKKSLSKSRNPNPEEISGTMESYNNYKQNAPQEPLRHSSAPHESAAIRYFLEKTKPKD